MHLTFQAVREQQEAEEMQKKMGLDDEDDSLVMMLKVTNACPNEWNSQVFTSFALWLIFLSLWFFLCSKGSSPESRILTVSCLTWKQNTPKKVPNPKKGKKQKSKMFHIS